MVRARTIELYRAMHVPTYQLAQHYFRSLMSAPIKLHKIIFPQLLVVAHYKFKKKFEI